MALVFKVVNITYLLISCCGIQSCGVCITHLFNSDLVAHTHLFQGSTFSEAQGPMLGLCSSAIFFDPIN